MTRSPVVVVGIDASEITLVERLCAEGAMPALQALRARGHAGVLRSEARTFAGSVWPSFYTGTAAAWHGVYHNKLWRPEAMRCEVPRKEWLDPRPFWSDLPSEARIAILDVPTSLGPPERVPGVHLLGWGAHDLAARGSWPTDLWPEVQRRFGRPVMPAEEFGPQTPGTLLRLRENLLRATRQMGAIAEWTLRRERWDLLAVVFGATHRGGHYLWDLSQIDEASLDPATRRLLEGALVEVYRECDQALARIVEAAPADARVLVVALHGMGVNSGWSDRCAQILARIQGGDGTGGKTGLLYKVKSALPWPLLRQVTTRLPVWASERLVELWSARMFDWRTTRVFPLPMDHAGYLRVSVRGRERDGIVDPRVEYDATCDAIEQALRSFVDVDTGEPIVDRVFRVDDVAPLDATHRHLVPDLVVTWRERFHGPRSRGIRSPRFGEMRWDDRLPSGRSGNHFDRGWLVAAGPGIEHGGSEREHSTLDLAPTVLSWMGVRPPDHLQGQAIGEICRAPATAG